MTEAQAVWNDLDQIRREAPLVHNITNYVAMSISANALLALGASPVMAHAAEEVEEMVGIARALVLNIGTLSGPWIEAMSRAARTARQRVVPIVLDPVGAGATRLRTDTCLRLIRETPPTIIRGNASEILALVSAGHGTKGVDSTHGSEAALDAAHELSRRAGCVVTVSGAVDLIVEGDAVIRIANGNALMTKVTGLGCAATALVGAFAAVNRSAREAAAHGMAVMGIAGEMAAEQSRGPGSLQAHLLDVLHRLTETDICERLEMGRK